jgi:hypothetical protein
MLQRECAGKRRRQRQQRGRTGDKRTQAGCRGLRQGQGASADQVGGGGGRLGPP